MSAAGFIWGHLTAKLVLPTTNLQGRVIIITGGNTGLGLHTAIHLARLNPAKLILACRDTSKGELAGKMVSEVTGLEQDRIESWKLDLASFDSVKSFATRCETDLVRLDVVVENAGAMTLKFEKTIDGWERNFQVNDLATGLLGLLLLPLLSKTATLPSPTPDIAFKPRLTFVGSEMHQWASFTESKVEGSTLDALNNPNHFVPDDRYNVTKLFSIYLAHEISKLPVAKDMIVNVVNPGLCISSFRRELPGFVQVILDSIAWKTETGAKNIAFAAVELGIPSGAYISACKVETPGKNVTSEEGKKLEQKVWLEMVDVWKSIAPELDI